jgi:hypothetical protein
MKRNRMNYPKDISVIAEERVALTFEESDRFDEALFLLLQNVQEPDVSLLFLFGRDEGRWRAPLKRIALCADMLRERLFAQTLLTTTLDLYHETHEWLGLFYVTALKSDEGFDVIADALINGPVEHRTFLAKVIRELEAEIRYHIANDYCHTPYDLIHKDSTWLFFDQVYRDALPRVIALRHAVIWRRSLFD